MGLSYPVIKGITKRGYKLPTPVQRKTIPMILEGRNVVAMAKTGMETNTEYCYEEWKGIYNYLFFI